MGGKVLEYEAKTIYREGMQAGMREGKQAGLREGKQAGLREGKQAGLREGEQIGREQNLLDLIQRKMTKGQSVEQIADALEETPERIQELMQTF